MPKVRDVMDVLEQLAPKRYAFPFDKVGLQVGDPNAEVTAGVVSLDRSLGAIEFAEAEGAQMLVSHHPLIFEPLGTVLQTSHVGRTVLELAKKNIAFAAAHTNWDSARGGINDALAERLGLTDVEDFGTAAAVSRLKLIVFCPPDSVEKIIDAASEAGAGVIGDYSRCAFLIDGTGTFKGSEESHPVIGEPGEVEHTKEVRVEMALPEDKARDVARAIKRVHPYEEPAYDFNTLAPDSEQPAGRIGSLPQPTPLRHLAGELDALFDTRCWTWGKGDRPIKRLAIVGGAADSEWRKARQAGANALLTGEVKQHVGLEASEEGFSIIAAGHYATEQPGCEALCSRLEEIMAEIDWKLFVPPPGLHGRPF